MSTKSDDFRSERDSSSLENSSRTSYDLRKRARVSLTVSHPYESTPEVTMKVLLLICFKLVFDQCTLIFTYF